MTICECLAKQLTIIREECGMTVTDFSCLLGISRSSLQSILSCKANPRSDTIEQIAHNLQIDPIVLLTPPSETGQPIVITEETMKQLLEFMRKMWRENHERDD